LATYQLRSVQKLQRALHAKAKAEAGYRFYALYDKIYGEDILAHAYAQCRSTKGAAGVDGQEFADVEAYGVERWLGELALALREETYRPDPISRVFIPKANGKLRPLGISTLRDRVCMTAAMLVLDPIFEADLPPEQYAYRAGRNAQQAVVEVGRAVVPRHPEVVDAYLADYFGSRTGGSRAFAQHTHRAGRGLSAPAHPRRYVLSGALDSSFVHHTPQCN
jgi:RNA-directed DNA polymerase